MDLKANAYSSIGAVPLLSETAQLETGVTTFGESLAVVLAILFFSGVSLAVLGVEQGYGLNPTKHDRILSAVQWLVYLVSLPYLFRYRDVLYRCAKKQKLIWILVLFALVSAFWSQVPLQTTKNSLLLGLSTAWGVYFGARYSLRNQLQLLAWAFGLAIAASYLLAVTLPNYGIMTWDHVGSWEGIYPHRNALARMMVLAVLVFVFRARIKDAPRLFCTLAIAGASVLLLLSRSMTGPAILLLLIILTLLSPLLRWSRWRLLFSVSLLGVVAVCLFLWLPWLKILALLGRNMTLTGRLPLWILVGMKALQRPWLGYGYNGFWLGLDGESRPIWTAMHWAAPNAHNGFLDLWIGLGLAGLTIFISGYAFVFWRAFKAARSSRNVESLWPLAYLAFLFLYNLDETNLFQHNSLMWALYVAVSASMISGLRMQPIASKPAISGIGRSL